MNQQFINDFEQKLFDIFNKSTLVKEQRIILAYSGGIDSLALAIIIDKWNEILFQRKKQIFFCIVDHKYLEDDTKNTILAKQILAQYIKSTHNIITLTISHEKQKILGNTENYMRQIRYKMIEDFAKKQHVTYIITAHHADDNVETFFINLLRGSSISGLTAMKNYTSKKNHIIYRPLLEISKEQLKEYLVCNKYQWIEDLMNQDDSLLRNKIHDFLADIVGKKLFRTRILNTIKHLQRCEEFVLQTTQELFKHYVKFEKHNNACRINYHTFITWKQEIANRIMIEIIMKIGKNTYKPRARLLNDIYQDIIKNKNFVTKTINHCSIESNRYNNIEYIIFTPENKSKSKLDGKNKSNI